MIVVRPLVSSRIIEQELLEFENSKGMTLPDDYRTFLLQYNGGAPQPSNFFFRSEQGEEDSLIEYFFSLSPTGQLYSLEENLKEYNGRIPGGLLPIACDPFGNLVLLSIAEGTSGKIYFWDHEKETERPGVDSLSLLADSFTRFTQMLTMEEEPSIP